MRRVLCVGLAIAAMGACALPSSSEFAKPVVADGGSPDDANGPVSTPALHDAAAGPDDGGELVLDGGADAAPIVDLLQPIDSTFDTDNDQCGNDSGSFQASLTPSTTAHTGSGACLLCRTSTGNGKTFTLDTQIRDVHPRAGQQFMATAYARRPPGAKDQGSMTLALRAHNGDFVAVNEADSPPTTLTDDYQLLTITLDMTADTSNLDVFLGDTPPNNDNSPCFLVDDVYVWQSK